MEDLTVATIDRLMELEPARVLEIDGFKHIDKDKECSLFTPPVPTPIAVDTLSGFVRLLEIGFESFAPATTLVHVAAFDEVRLIARVSDKYGRRQQFVTAKAIKPERQFPFNQFIAQEVFNINLRSMFAPTDDLDALVSAAGNIAKQSELKQEDDGFSQSVSMKNGKHLVKTVTLKPRVTLKPFRTFLEVDQPDGEYIFRVQYDEQKGNLCALIEADAGRWKLTAMNTIREWLTNQLKGSLVEELNDLPVVA